MTEVVTGRQRGKDLFSEGNWFDHFTPSYTQALIHAHTRTPSTHVTGKTRGTEAQPCKQQA